MEGDKFRFEKSSGDSPDVTFRCGTGILALMMSGRLDASEAISQGSLEVEGDIELAARFGQWFKGI